MWKKVTGVAVIAILGYAAYDYYEAGYFNAPDTEEGDFLLSYKNGFRAVMRGAEDERSDRRYFGYVNKNTPSVYADSWSECRSPTQEETAGFNDREERFPGERLDGVCEIDADGEVFIRGWVSSIPDV